MFEQDLKINGKWNLWNPMNLYPAIWKALAKANTQVIQGNYLTIFGGFGMKKAPRIQSKRQEKRKRKKKVSKESGA